MTDPPRLASCPHGDTLCVECPRVIGALTAELAEAKRQLELERRVTDKAVLESNRQIAGLVTARDAALAHALKATNAMADAVLEMGQARAEAEAWKHKALVHGIPMNDCKVCDKELGLQTEPARLAPAPAPCDHDFPERDGKCVGCGKPAPAPAPKGPSLSEQASWEDKPAPAPAPKEDPQ